MSEFDIYAEDYEAALNRGIAVSGETRDYFAAGRIQFLSQCLADRGLKIRRAMDYGCGTGTALPYLHKHFHPEVMIGLDLSERSLGIAKQNYSSLPANFHTLQEFEPDATIDLVFCNGVFHHIPPHERKHAVQFVFDCLQPGGWFAFWENNPWSPAARYVMSKIPFDRDAIMVWPRQARRLLADAGFEIERTDFRFVFPAQLSALRPLEDWVTKLPWGAQYQVLARKPS